MFVFDIIWPVMMSLTLQAVRLIQFKSATQADLVLYFSRIIARRYNQYQIIPVVVVVSFQL